jgi:hypothetical protein
MWLQFFSQNAHFVINLFAALVCLGTCWLYFDAWSNRHDKKELLRWVGFLVLGLSFLLQSTIIEQSVLGKSMFGQVSTLLGVITRLIGYGAIIFGQLVEPLQAVPDNKGLVMDKSDKPSAPAAVILGTIGTSFKILVPFGSLAISALYWRRATTGLERHLKPIAKAFILFAISDLLAQATLLRGTSNPVLYSLVAAFGWVWWAQQIALLGGVIVLGLWTWGYLLERFFSQLFMIFISMIVIVFMIVSVGFTSLLLRNIQTDNLKNLSTAANVLNYALGAKQAQTASAAGQLAGSTDVLNAINNRDREQLKKLTSTYLADNKLTGLILTNQSGQVLLRAEDSEQWGDSVSNDDLIKRALLGISQSTMSVHSGTSAPIMQVRSAVTVKDAAGNIAGGVLASVDLSSAFVDGIKKTTGLQSSIYSGNTLSATTLLSPDGKTRPIGVKISDINIKDKVLVKGQIFSGILALQHKQMLAVFVPIKDVDNSPIGMLLVAQPGSSILQTAGHSVEVTFIIMAIILLLSIYPIMLVVKALVRQIS